MHARFVAGLWHGFQSDSSRHANDAAQSSTELMASIRPRRCIQATNGNFYGTTYAEERTATARSSK